MISINKCIKTCAGAMGAVMLSAVMTAGFYGMSLPGKYFIGEGEELEVSTVLPVTARTDGEHYVVAASDLTARSSRVTDNTLMLFGVIPIKSVTATQSQRPELVPCGTPFGIKLTTEGVMVVEVSAGSAASRSGIRRGDIILSVDGENIRTNGELSQVILSSGGESCTVELTRQGKRVTAALTPVNTEGGYRAGMWVRDSSAGIGTLTCYDPATGQFGGLGHGVCDCDTRELMPLKEGQVCGVELTGLVRSERGSPGQLVGEFRDSLRGDITKNLSSGVFGTLDSAPVDTEPLELGFRQEIRRGSASIITCAGGEPREYAIEIEEIDLSSDAEHDMVIRVVDPELLDKAGGIVQGMSGSPIIQNGRLVGAVTHVFVNDPSGGYGIFADRMLEEGFASRN